MELRKSLVVCAFAALTGASGVASACGVTGLSAPSSTSAATSALRFVDLAVSVVLEGTTTLGTLFGSVLGAILSPLIAVTEVQLEDPSFVPDVRKGVDQIKAQAELGNYSSCGSCVKAGADLADLLK